MSDLGYEYSQDGVCLSSFDHVDLVFVHKEVRSTNETKTAQNTKLYNYIYTRGFSNELETFSTSFCFLEALSVRSSSNYLKYFLKTNVSEF